jgi:release factor glutamine methyltransferase
MKKSIREALTEAGHSLQLAGISDARIQATSLLMHTLGVDRGFVIAHPEYELSSDQYQAFGRFVSRRASREPLQYIVGYQEFFKLRFAVTPDVLIPRPETEMIVESALSVGNKAEPISILDVGTGSGCIVISLLHELQNARGAATDVSPGALQVAARNAENHQVIDRLTLIQAGSLSVFDGSSVFSLIVSNPPYVPAGDIEILQPEVREHEPVTALVSGADGLDHVRDLLRETPRLLKTNGYFIFEIGFGQREVVEPLIDLMIWELVEVKRDLRDIPRTVILRKR